jgi:glycosyltransferase involved in cell wall biosynthesis
MSMRPSCRQHTQDTVDHPTISFVVPAYNVEEWIVQAMTSILDQNPLPHEIIVVDDGSLDGTALKLARYLENPIVQIISRPNGGLGSARNLGLSRCSGEYVFFMDSDDLIPQHFMQRISQVVRESAFPDLVLFAGTKFSDQEPVRGAAPTFARNVSGTFPESGSLLRMLVDTQSLHAAAWLSVSRVQMWVDNHILFPDVIHEDEAVLFPVMTSARSAVVIEDSLYNYRVRPHSIIASGPSSRTAQAALVITKVFLRGVLERSSMNDPDVDLWRWRGAHWAGTYLRFSRRFQAEVDWRTTLRAMVAFRRTDVLWECLCSMLPRWAYRALRAVARFPRHRLKRGVDSL